MAVAPIKSLIHKKAVCLHSKKHCLQLGQRRIITMAHGRIEIQRVSIGGHSDFALTRQMHQERLNRHASHRFRMPHAMKSNENENPVNVHFLSRKRKIMEANPLANFGQ